MNKQQTFNYHENIIPDNQVQNFLNELGALQGGIDVYNAIQSGQYQYIISLDSKSFVIVFNDDYDLSDSRIAYVRVSTDTQKERSTSVSKQYDEAKKFCEYKGYTLSAVCFDLGISGDNMQLIQKAIVDMHPTLNIFQDIRPGLHFALSHLTSNNKLLAFDPSRLWRENDNTGALIRIIIMTMDSDFEFVEHPTISLRETENNKVMMNQMNYVIADYDRRQNVSKLADGRRRSALSGKRAGVDPGYGYTFNEENKRVIVPEEAAVIRKIYRMQRSRMRQSDIANTLNEEGLTRRGSPWTKLHIHRVVNAEGRRKYGGYISYGKNKDGTPIEQFYQDLVIIPYENIS